MQPYPRVLALVLCIVFSCASGASADEELNKLQGSWVGVETGHDNDGEVTIAIDGDTIIFTGWRDGEWYKGTIEVARLDGRSTLVGTIKKCPMAEFIGKASNAIYNLEDDTLTIAARAPGDPAVPKDFDDASARSFVLKKHR